MAGKATVVTSTTALVKMADRTFIRTSSEVLSSASIMTFTGMSLKTTGDTSMETPSGAFFGAVRKSS